MALTVRFQAAPTLMSHKSLLYASRTFSLSDVETEEHNQTNLLRKNVESLCNDGLGDQRSSHFRAAADCGSLGLSCRPEKRMLTIRQAANQRYEIEKQAKARNQTPSHFRAAVNCASPGLACQPIRLTVCQAANQRYEVQKQEKARNEIPSHFRAALDWGSPSLSCRPEKRMLTVRQAVNQRYEIQKQERARMKLKMKTRQGKIWQA